MPGPDVSIRQETRLSWRQLRGIYPTPRVTFWILLLLFGRQVKGDELGVIHVICVDDFGRSVTGVAVSVKDRSGEVISDPTKKLPYGNYQVAVRRAGSLILNRDVDLDQPTKTILAFFPGYYGDYTKLPVIPVAVSGLPQSLHVFARAFSLYGTFTSESELDAKGEGLIPDMTPGIYVIAIFSGEQILGQKVARIEPWKKIPFIRFRLDHAAVRARSR